MSSRSICKQCWTYVNGCKCDEPDSGSPEKEKSETTPPEDNDLTGYSWDEVKDATNRLYKRHFNHNIDDYVRDVANMNLPSCVYQILAYCAVYTLISEQDKEDLKALQYAYIQLQEDGVICKK